MEFAVLDIFVEMFKFSLKCTFLCHVQSRMVGRGSFESFEDGSLCFAGFWTTIRQSVPGFGVEFGFSRAAGNMI